MNKKEKQELQGKTKGELEKMISEKKKELAKAKVEILRAAVKNVHVVKTLRGQLARLNTLAREKAA